MLVDELSVYKMLAEANVCVDIARKDALEGLN